jgi:ABC-type multidrug transport system fused ATPase/permease subunit
MAFSKLSKTIFYFGMVLLLLLGANFCFAANTSTNATTLEDVRASEINSSIDLAIIILLLIIFAIVIFLVVDHFAKKKHVERARKVAKKAKIIVNQAEQEEQEELEKQQQLNLKSAKLKKSMQEKLRLQRMKNKHSKKRLVFSEFDDSEYLKPNEKYSRMFSNKKKEVFLNLDSLGKHKKVPKRNKNKQKKSDTSIFDKLDNIND